MKQQYIDKIYSIAKHEYKDKKFSFTEIWKKISKDAKFSKEEQLKLLGVVYGDLLQDPRFVYVGKQKWRLRELCTQDELKKYQNAIYDFDNQPEEIDTTGIISKPEEGEENVEVVEEEVSAEEEDEEDEQDLIIANRLKEKDKEDEDE